MIIISLLILGFLFTAVSLRFRGVQKGLIGFLHPASGAGGGGERVLWVAIQHLLQSNPQHRVALYTTEFPAPASSPMSSDDYLLEQLVPKQFGIKLSLTERSRLKIHYIPLQHLQDPNLYPVARLLLQSLVGGFALAAGFFYSLLVRDRKSSHQIPELLIDTVGIPFSYPFLRLGFLLLSSTTPQRIGCYVHYPYISTDMIDSVVAERVMPNNPTPAKGLKKQLKLVYYRAMVMMYRYLAGALVNGPIACNSNWTRNHIINAWTSNNNNNNTNNSIQLLFPPVNVDRFKQFDLTERFALNKKNKEIILISVGQFRPEKDHPLLIKAFSKAVSKLRRLSPQSSTTKITLKVIGGARNQEDKDRAVSLQRLVDQDEVLSELKNNSYNASVQFCLNAPFEELENAFRTATVGLHTMRDEHFGIVVVEYMASGCITIAHRSAGPLEIVGTDQRAGYLCETEDEYATEIVRVLENAMENEDNNALQEMQIVARKASGKYGDAGFGESFEKIFLGK